MSPTEHGDGGAFTGAGDRGNRRGGPRARAEEAQDGERPDPRPGIPNGPRSGAPFIRAPVRGPSGPATRGQAGADRALHGNPIGCASSLPNAFRVRCRSPSGPRTPHPKAFHFRRPSDAQAWAKVRPRPIPPPLLLAWSAERKRRLSFRWPCCGPRRVTVRHGASRARRASGRHVSSAGQRKGHARSPSAPRGVMAFATPCPRSSSSSRWSGAWTLRPREGSPRSPSLEGRPRCRKDLQPLRQVRPSPLAGLRPRGRRACPRRSFGTYGHSRRPRLEDLSFSCWTISNGLILRACVPFFSTPALSSACRSFLSPPCATKRSPRDLEEEGKISTRYRRSWANSLGKGASTDLTCLHSTRASSANLDRRSWAPPLPKGGVHGA